MPVIDESYPTVCNACGSQFFPRLEEICPNCGHDNDHETSLRWMRSNRDRFEIGKVYGAKCVFCDKKIYGSALRLVGIGDGEHSHAECLNISRDDFEKRVGPGGEWVR